MSTLEATPELKTGAYAALVGEFDLVEGSGGWVEAAPIFDDLAHLHEMRYTLLVAPTRLTCGTVGCARSGDDVFTTFAVDMEMKPILPDSIHSRYASTSSQYG